jgi:hypothetical protein
MAFTFVPIRPPRRLTAVVLAATVLTAAGCVSGGRTSFGVVARQSAPNFRPLRQGVEGEACSSPLATDDYRRATEAAIAKVPGANSLSDVTMQSRETLNGGFCLIVRGTAGVLE